MQLPTILVVDGDPKARQLLRGVFETEGFAVIEAHDQNTALAVVDGDHPTLVTLDIQLAAGNGIDVLRAIRRHSDVAILVVTGRNDVIDRVVGLELGADDYVAKPFHPRELIARVHSVLRRTEHTFEATENNAESGLTWTQGHTILKFDGLIAHLDRFELVARDGQILPITSGEFRLLIVFVHSAKRSLTRDRIMDLLNGTAWTPFDRTVDNHVARLRKLIERDASQPKLIKTIRGVGYLFTAEVTQE